MTLTLKVDSCGTNQKQRSTFLLGPQVILALMSPTRLELLTGLTCIETGKPKQMFFSFFSNVPIPLKHTNSAGNSLKKTTKTSKP